MRRKWKRALSLLCTLAMIAGMLPVSSLAAAGTAQTVSGGINGYAAAMQADEVTNQQTVWQNAFYLNGERSADLNGKIWTDKSVEISTENPEQFNVTFSALGQTFASQEASQSQIAFDVVFVVDVSSSMSWDVSGESTTRMQATVNALNLAASTLMENPNNRMSVVRFSSNAATYVPLGHYSKSSQWGNEQNYFSVSNSNYHDITFTAQDFSGRRSSLEAGTNQQSGYFEAGDVLTSAEMPEGNAVKRIPVVIMLTDGDPDTPPEYGITSNWKTGEAGDGSTQVNNPGSSDHFYTICTAAYQKDLIQNHYRSSSMNNDNSTTARIYTIGLGLDEYTGDW